MAAVYKIVELTSRGRRYEIFNAEGTIIGQGQGNGPSDLPTREEYIASSQQPSTTGDVPSNLDDYEVGEVISGQTIAQGGSVGDTFQRVETIQTPSGEQKTIRTYRIIETPGGLVETDITNEDQSSDDSEIDDQGNTSDGPSSNSAPCDVRDLPGGEITEIIEDTGTDLPNQSQYVVIRTSGRVDQPVAILLNTDTGEEFRLEEGSVFQGALVQAIDREGKTVRMDDGTMYYFVDEEQEREPIDPSRYTTEFIRGLSNGVASIFDNETNRGFQVGVGDTIGGFRIRTIDFNGITLEDGTVITYGGIQTNPGGDTGNGERQGAPTGENANEFGEVVAPMSGGSGR